MKSPIAQHHISFTSLNQHEMLSAVQGLLPQLTLTPHPHPYSNSWSHRESSYAVWLKGNIYIVSIKALLNILCLVLVITSSSFSSDYKQPRQCTHTFPYHLLCLWALRLGASAISDSCRSWAFLAELQFQNAVKSKKPWLACWEIAIRGRQYTILQESEMRKNNSPFTENMAKLRSYFLGVFFFFCILWFK